MHLVDIPHNTTAIIVASGKSVSDIDLNILQNANATIIAVNGAINYINFAHIVFTLDTLKLTERFELPNFSGLKIATVPEDYGTTTAKYKCDRVTPRSDVIYYKLEEFSMSGSDHIMTGCSGFGAMQLAIKLGAKEIFLFGCDHSEQGEYFYGNDRKSGTYTRRWEEALQNWENFNVPADVQIFNVSPDSNIQKYRKIMPNEAFTMLGLQ